MNQLFNLIPGSQGDLCMRLQAPLEIAQRKREISCWADLDFKVSLVQLTKS